MKNVNYHYSNDRYSSMWTLRFKGIYATLRRDKVAKTWHFYIKRIIDLDILGLYHEIGWKVK